MPFTQFAFPQVCTELGLKLSTAPLFAGVPSRPPTAEFAARLAEDAQLAVDTGTEKARSEFVIAPLLLELRRGLPGKCGLHSGVEFEGDAARGLNGVCDFLVTKSPNQLVVEAPVLVVVEAKPDTTRAGLGQCIAAMAAAQIYNQRAGTPRPRLYGACTTGTLWRFVCLEADTVTAEPGEHLIDDPGRILGILRHIVETA